MGEREWWRGGERLCYHVDFYPFPKSKIAVLCYIGNTTSVFLPAQEKTFFASQLCSQSFRRDQVAAAERCSGWDRGMLRLGHEPAAGTEVVLWEWDFMSIFRLPQAVPGWDNKKFLRSSPVDGGQLG